MIYIIESAGMREINGIKEYFSIIKIGYTKDKNLEKRKSNYLTHNPTYKVLRLIPNGTEEQEKKLHHKFKEKKFINKEWFEFDQTIIDYLSSVTLEELDQLSPSPSRVNKSQVEFMGIYDLVVDVLRRRGVKDFSNYPTKSEVGSRIGQYKEPKDLYNIFGLTEEEVKEVVRRDSIDFSQFSEEIQDFLGRFNNLSRYTERMKYLCGESINFSESDLGVIFRQIPLNFGQYITTLGIDLIRANGYQKSRLDRVYNSSMSVIFDFSSLDNEVYGKFKEGGKYTLVELKEGLKEIFKDRDLDIKGVNAKTILNYFETKTCKVLVGLKNKDGYKLIKRLR